MSDKLKRELLTQREDRILGYLETLREATSEADRFAHEIAAELGEYRELAVSIVNNTCAIYGIITILQGLIEKDKQLKRLRVKGRLRYE